MKRSMKKYLILALVVMAIMVMTVCSASAVNYTCSNSNCRAVTTSPIYINIKDAKCESAGTAELACPQCRTSFNITVEIEPSKGHSFGVAEYVESVDGPYYESARFCTAKNCGVREIEHDKDNNIVKYHKMIFVNHCATGSYKKDYKFANVVDTYKTTETEMFLKEGAGLIDAVREADNKSGLYVFRGWTRDADSATRDSAVYNADFIKIDEVPADVADCTVYAVFEPDATSQYTIQFFTESGYLIEKYTTVINHGYPITFELGGGELKDVQKADDAIYTYKFAGWVWMGDGKTPVKEGDRIYGAPSVGGQVKVLNLQATYERTPREYLLKYLDRNGNPIVMSDGKYAEDIVTIGTFADGSKKEADNGKLIESSKDAYPTVHTKEDLVYTYAFTGKWLINGTSRVVDIHNLDLTGLIDTNNTNAPIELVPQYEPTIILYPISITTKFENDKENHPKEVTITIKDADGNFVDAKKFVDTPEGGVYKYIAKLPYAERYYIVITAEAYSVSGVVEFDENEKEFTVFEQKLMHNEKEDCDCICHSFLQPVIVKIYNVINSLFKKKIVCCDDMYATLGDRLNYRN